MVRRAVEDSRFTTHRDVPFTPSRTPAEAKEMLDGLRLLYTAYENGVHNGVEFAGNHTIHIGATNRNTVARAGIGQLEAYKNQIEGAFKSKSIEQLTQALLHPSMRGKSLAADDEVKLAETMAGYIMIGVQTMALGLLNVVIPTVTPNKVKLDNFVLGGKSVEISPMPHKDGYMSDDRIMVIMHGMDQYAFDYLRKAYDERRPLTVKFVSDEPKDELFQPQNKMRVDLIQELNGVFGEYRFDLLVA